jgi:PAS domain S-box-containing protein
MRTTPDPAAAMLAVTFSSEGLILALSSGAEQIVGYSSRELIGWPITHIMADRSVFEMPEMIASVKESGFWEGALTHRDRSGNDLEATSNLILLAGHGKTGHEFLLVSSREQDRPQTEPCNAELGEVGAKLRAFAHELNNPLAVMMGFSQLIMLNPNCGNKVRADMDKIYSEMQRVVHVAEKLHSYAVTLQEDSRLKPAANNQ